MIVLDASCANKLFLPNEEGHQEVKEIIRQHLRGSEQIIVPDLLYYEVANTLVTKTEIILEYTLESLAQLYSLNLRVIPISEKVLSKSAEFAIKYKVTVYDAVYAVIAKQKKCNLITSDEKFIKAVNLPFVKLLSDIELIEGVEDIKAGRVVPWKKVKKKAGID